MLYRQFQDKQLSMLGFGTMRLPTREDGTIDEVHTQRMVDYAMAHGINYFDTAFPYHEGNSEIVIGKLLKKYPRESYCLATKYPGHQISQRYDPKAIFQRQLEKCGVEYFDFYLLHNVYENSIQVYKDERWGILDYFKEQKRLGRIKHLGFSSHGRPDNLREFLEYCGEDMEFCQIQLNYLDWTLQQAGEKYDLLRQWNIPIWVMEPLRGGKLARLSEEQLGRLAPFGAQHSAADWALRFLQDLPGVTVVLSGMSTMEQMEENVAVFQQQATLSQPERETLFALAEEMKGSVPCTACRYCCDGCPMGLDIPRLLATYNDVRYAPSVNVVIGLDALPPEKRPEACISCGACTRICPQNIDIPTHLAELARQIEKLPKWADICRQREAAQKL